MDTPPTVALSARIKYSFVGVIRKAQVLAIREMVPKTPSGREVQNMVKNGKNILICFNFSLSVYLLLPCEQSLILMTERFVQFLSVLLTITSFSDSKSDS